MYVSKPIRLQIYAKNRTTATRVRLSPCMWAGASPADSAPAIVLSFQAQATGGIGHDGVGLAFLRLERQFAVLVVDDEALAGE